MISSIDSSTAIELCNEAIVQALFIAGSFTVLYRTYSSIYLLNLSNNTQGSVTFFNFTFVIPQCY